MVATDARKIAKYEEHKILKIKCMYQWTEFYNKKYRIQYMRASHMFFFSVKVFEKVPKLENSPFYSNGFLQY